MAPGTKQEKEEALLRVISYHRRDFYFAVHHSQPDALKSVPQYVSQASPPSSAVLSPLDRFSRLPAEIIIEVASYLDVRSYFNFRQVSQVSRHVLTGLSSYQIVVRHALECLGATLRLRLGHYFYLADLVDALHRIDCIVCGDFGHLVFLPTLDRCCYACLRKEQRGPLAAVTLSAFAKCAMVAPSRVRQVTRVAYTCPGVYALRRQRKKARFNVVSVQHALDSLRVSGKDVEPEWNWGSDPISSNYGPPRPGDLYAHMVSTTLPHLDRKTGQVQHGLSCTGCHLACELPDVGQQRRGDVRDLVYSRKGLVKHFRSCQYARKLWADSHEGTNEVDHESEFIKRGGYISE